MAFTLGILMCGQGISAWAASDSKSEGSATKAQAVCPISGEAVDGDSPHVDFNGKRIYACCQSCVKTIQKDPAKTLMSMMEKGQEAEDHWALCPKCGQIKGTKACCAKGAAKCGMCKLDKGSPACCQHLKLDGDKEVLLCTKCGQIEGTKACCAKGAKKCPMCKLDKGSPACCKLGKMAEGSASKEDHDHAHGHDEAASAAKEESGSDSK
jgi:hypothetical protein